MTALNNFHPEGKERSIIRFAAVVACLCAVVLATATPGGAEVPTQMSTGHAVRPCLDDWRATYRSDGTTFDSLGACVSYAATGGLLSYLRVAFVYLDPSAPDETYFRSEGNGSGLLPGSTVEMWARFAPATVSPWLGELAGQTIRVNGGTVEADGTTIRAETAAPTFFGNYLRCSGPVGPFPGQLWDQIWVTGVSAGGVAISSPLYGYGSVPALPC